MTSTAHAAFLTELTQTLNASGWTRTDRDHFGMTIPEFTHHGTPAVLTIALTDTTWATPSAFLLHDETDPWWRVACDNPHPSVLTAAANATLADDTGDTSRGVNDRPLKQRLQEAGWTSGYASGRTGQTHWTAPDGSEAVCFPYERVSPPAWLIHRRETATGAGLAQYAPTRATPNAVLAALALTPVPPASTGTALNPPDASDATA